VKYISLQLLSAYIIIIRSVRTGKVLQDSPAKLIKAAAPVLASKIIENFQRLKDCRASAAVGDRVEHRARCACITIADTDVLDVLLIKDICRKHLDFNAKNESQRRYWLAHELKQRKIGSSKPHSSNQPLRWDLCVKCFQAYHGQLYHCDTLYNCLFLHYHNHF